MNSEPEAIPDFSLWLLHARESLRTGCGTDVPCGSCSACCTSSFFIHIQPHETKALRAIPRELLFQAPGMPKGNFLMGFDERGRCPMFTDSGCSIYDSRPRTCRCFDCRVLAAAGLYESAGKEAINQQIDRWKFNTANEQERITADAVKISASFILEHAALFPSGFVPGNPVQQAALAVIVYDVFLDSQRQSWREWSSDQRREIITAIVSRYRTFYKETAENI
jgi:Fe-S-cluster containining protein